MHRSEETDSRRLPARPSKVSRFRITKQKIVDAALPIFMKKGFQGTSMREIAASLGIKAGSLYNHIRSKDEILERIHDGLIDGLLTKSEEIAADDTTSSREKVELFIETLLRSMAESRSYAIVFFGDYKYLPPRVFAKITKKRKRVQEVVRGILKDGIEKSEFRWMDVDMVAMGIFGMTIWSHTWIDPDGRLRVEEIAKIFSDILLDGLGREAGPETPAGKRAQFPKRPARTKEAKNCKR